MWLNLGRGSLQWKHRETRHATECFMPLDGISQVLCPLIAVARDQHVHNKFIGRGCG